MKKREKEKLCSLYVQFQNKICATTSPLCAEGVGDLQSIFQKGGLDRTSTFREGC